MIPETSMASLACQQDVACNGLLLWFKYTTQVVKGHGFQHPQHSGDRLGKEGYIPRSQRITPENGKSRNISPKKSGYLWVTIPKNP